MTDPGWSFHKMDPTARVRNPIQGEFFASESITGPAEALVREAIQNALDAREGASPVFVRIFISGSSGAVPPEVIEKYTGAAFWEHVRAVGNGLRTPPSAEEPCPFVVVEDFGTTGLLGDIREWKPLESVSNPFFYFFRAEGLTDKREGKAGSWGVGKTVFPRSSRANAIVALTVRSQTPARLLMGTMTLKTHVNGGTWYDPDAWFGVEELVEGTPLILPLASAGLMDEFSSDFRLRRAGEAGLSVVVPWHDAEISTDSVRAAVVRQWFYPLLKGDLIVAIEDPGQSSTIDAATLDQHLKLCEDRIQKETGPAIALSTHLCGLPPTAIISLSTPAPEKAPRWSADLLPEGAATRIRRELESGKPVAVRVPLVVRRKRGGYLESRFDIVLSRDPEAASGKVTFIRNGIMIPDVRTPRVRGVRALVARGRNRPRPEEMTRPSLACRQDSSRARPGGMVLVLIQSPNAAPNELQGLYTRQDDPPGSDPSTCARQSSDRT